MALVMTTLGEVVTAQLKLRPFKTAFFKAPDNGSPVKQSLHNERTLPGGRVQWFNRELRSLKRKRRLRMGFCVAETSYTRTTFAAWKPFGPLVRSNSTVSPSFKLRYPLSWIAEKCTKTSSPVDR